MSSYDSMRKKMGLKQPGKRTLAKRAEKRKTDTLSMEQVGEVNARMGLGPGDPNRHRRYKGKKGKIREPKTLFSDVTAMLGG